MNPPQEFDSNRPDLRRVCVHRVISDQMPKTADGDLVAVEAPLEIRLHGRPAAVLMRTPGNDRELVTGFLFCEGVIADPRHILAIDPVEDGDKPMGGVALDVRLDSPSRGRGIERFFYSTSSCGACGKRDIDSLAISSPAIHDQPSIPISLLQSVADIARRNQPLFAVTGGTHASALFGPDGALVSLMEDVGRHNALDKVVGASLEAGRIPLAGHVLAISGRVGYEIIQKALAAGIPAIVAVGAPTGLAVELAESGGITLAGFARAGSMNIYSHAGRISN